MNNFGYGRGFGYGQIPEVMNEPNVENANAGEIERYIDFLRTNTGNPTKRNNLVNFLRKLVEARPGEFNNKITTSLVFSGIPEETMRMLLRASNGEINLAGVVLEHTDPMRPDMRNIENEDVPGTLEEDDVARGGKRRSRRATKRRRKNSRKSRKSHRRRRRV